mmetsp:Transcript_61544/g.120853  ORF Transcript_61544/g.120853 Transcript_61544/m.120853 type:complete len:220 (+) Transcript_61544:1579-2238(+)
MPPRQRRRLSRPGRRRRPPSSSTSRRLWSTATTAPVAPAAGRSEAASQATQVPTERCSEALSPPRLLRPLGNLAPPLLHSLTVETETQAADTARALRRLRCWWRVGCCRRRGAAAEPTWKGSRLACGSSRPTKSALPRSNKPKTSRNSKRRLLLLRVGRGRRHLWRRGRLWTFWTRRGRKWTPKRSWSKRRCRCGRAWWRRSFSCGAPGWATRRGGRIW